MTLLTDLLTTDAGRVALLELADRLAVCTNEHAALPAQNPANRGEPEFELQQALADHIGDLQRLGTFIQRARSTAAALTEAREVAEFEKDPKTRAHWYDEYHRLSRKYRAEWTTEYAADMSDDQRADREARDRAGRMYTRWQQADTVAAQSGALG